jgi:hypothetical protein
MDQALRRRFRGQQNRQQFCGSDERIDHRKNERPQPLEEPFAMQESGKKISSQPYLR